jgi:hypothetical protein
LSTIQSIAHGASSHVCVITFRLSAARPRVFNTGGGLGRSLVANMRA